MDTNVLTVTGRLGGDPELRHVSGTKSVCNFSLAVNGLKDDDTLWLRVSAWGKGGEAAAEYLSKGSRVSVTGRLRVREYEHKGEKRTSAELEAASFGGIVFLDSKGDGARSKPSGDSGGNAPPPGFDGSDDDPIPF